MPLLRTGFAILQSSDSEEDSKNYGGFTVVPKKSKNKLASGEQLKQTKKPSETRHIPGLAFASKAPLAVPLQSAGAGKRQKKDKKQENGCGAAEGPDTFYQEAEEADYKEELKKAILLSKLQFKEDQSAKTKEDEFLKEALQSSATVDCESHGKQKGKKPVTISLQEFQGGTSLDLTQENSDLIDSGQSASGYCSKTLDDILRECEREAEKVLAEEKASVDREKEQLNLEKVLINVYKARLEESFTENMTLMNRNRQLDEQIVELEGEVTKYKDRYRKSLRLLNEAEAETRDKVMLLAQLEKSKQVADEWCQQVQELNRELEQTRTRLHTFETTNEPTAKSTTVELKMKDKQRHHKKSESNS